MGGALSSSGKISAILTTLYSQPCPPSHQIWSSFSIYSFATNEFSAEDLENLIKIRNRRPDNFAELIRFIVEMFSKTAKLSETTPKVQPELQIYCGTISMLLSISGLPAKISPWFKAPALYLKSITPSHSLLQTIYRLFDFSSEMSECFAPRYLDDRIIFAKTLLFLQHAQAFSSESLQDPSPYLLSFDGFPSSQFLKSLFEMIPFALTESRSPTVLMYIKTLITMAIPPLYSCQSWKTALNNVEQNLIHKTFSTLFILLSTNINAAINYRILECAEQLVSLLYTVLARYPAYEKFIDINNLAPRYIASLLFLFQQRMETSSITFFHSIILLLISQLTSNLQSLLALNESFVSNFTTKYRPHRGTYADLIIEIITNPGMSDFVAAAPLIPLSVGIIENLSSTTVRLSFFSANRIFSYLSKFFSTKLAEKTEFVTPISQLLIAIFQFIRFHTIGNQSIILYGLDKKSIIYGLSQSSVEKWNTVAKSISTILEASDLPIRTKNQAEREKTLQNALSSVLSEFNDPPVASNSFTMSKEIEVVWYDWFRVLFWQLFPEEAEFYHLNFVSFQIPTATRVSKSLAEMPIEIPEKPPEQKEELVEVKKEEEEGEDDKLNETHDDTDDEEAAVSIIKSFRKEDENKTSAQRNLTIKLQQEQEIKQLFEKPTKHVQSLEELDNPFGSDDDDELAKFLDS